MQEIIVEKPYQFVPPHRGTWTPALIQRFRLVDHYLAYFEGVTSYEVRGIEYLKESLRQRAGVILAPNHCRYADPLAMGWIARDVGAHVYAMASWHLFNQNRLQTMAIRLMGGFSIFREGLDRQSLNTAVDILVNAERPLVLFPEGAVYRTNDYLQPLLDGIAFVARTAARRRQRKDGGSIKIHPVAIKYVFQGDLISAVEPIVARLENQLTLNKKIGLSLMDRIRRLAKTLLCVKELEYFGAVQSGAVVDRQRQLIDRLLQSHEEAWQINSDQAGVVPRIKQLRARMVPELTSKPNDGKRRAEIWESLADLYLAQQVASYPHFYLREPTTEMRILETVERMEEDVFDKATIQKPLHAILEVGQPIEVPVGKSPKEMVDPLLTELSSRLQEMLDQLAKESRPFNDRGQNSK